MSRTYKQRCRQLEAEVKLLETELTLLAEGQACADSKCALEQLADMRRAYVLDLLKPPVRRSGLLLAMDHCVAAGSQFFNWKGITYKADGTSLGCIACGGLSSHTKECQLHWERNRERT